MPRTPGEDDIRRVYRETIEELYGFVSRRADGDRDLAEDVVQDTWLRAVKAWRSDGMPDRPLSWLCTVAARLLSNHRRHAGIARVEDRPLDEIPDTSDPAWRTERRSLVDRALRRLPALQARLLDAFHFDHRSVAEIASASGLTQRAVEGRLRRARQLLRREIERDPAAQGELP